MEYKLGHTSHQIDASNPELLDKYLEEETLLTEIKSLMINSKDPQKTLEELNEKHKNLQIFVQETESGTRIQISRVTEFRPRRSSSVGQKPARPFKGKRGQNMIMDKKSPFGHALRKEFKKDKISGNLQTGFMGFGPGRRKKMRKNKSTSRLGIMRRYKQKKQTQNNFKVSAVPSDWNHGVKVLPHETLKAYGKPFFKKF